MGERQRILKTYVGGTSSESARVGAASDPSGSIYLLPVGFNPLRDAAPVLVMNSRGMEQKVLLCHLPLLSDGGAMLPIGVAASGSELAFVTSAGQVALFYLGN